MLRTALFAAVVTAGFLMVGCASHGERIDPTAEAVASHDFNPTDLQQIGDKSVEKLLKREVFAKADGKLTLFIAPVKNMTDEHINTSMIQDYLGTAFDETDKVRRIVAPEERKEAIAELERQQDAFVDPATAQRIGKLVGAQYMVSGRLTNMTTVAGSQKGQFFLFTLSLVKVDTGDVTSTQVKIQKLSTRGWFGW